MTNWLARYFDKRNPDNTSSLCSAYRSEAQLTGCQIRDYTSSFCSAYRSEAQLTGCQIRSSGSSGNTIMWL